MRAHTVDIAVLGAGPAGTAAALTLLKHTPRSVRVVEGTSFDAPRIGESLPGSARHLMAYLDLEDLLDDRAICLRCVRSWTAWNSPTLIERDERAEGGGEGRVLDRRAFDEALALRVRERGGTLMTGTWFRDVEPADDGWRLRLQTPQGPATLHARHVIDATGRRVSFARRVGERPLALDTMVAVSVDLRCVDPVRAGEPGIVVEAVEEGWWYATRLPRGRAIAVLMTDADLLAPLGLAEEDRFHAALARAPSLLSRLSGHVPEGRPRVQVARSQVLARPAGRHWTAAGDAALSPDPLSSAGIGHALASGIQAARIAHRALDGHGDLSATHAGDVDRHLRAFIARRQQVYAMEGRWPDAPFWSRRQGAGATVRHDAA